MKIQGNPGPDRITVTFEEGKYKGRSIKMDAEPIVGGVLLFGKTICCWDGEEHMEIDKETKKELVDLIKRELIKYPPSEIIE